MTFGVLGAAGITTVMMAAAAIIPRGGGLGGFIGPFLGGYLFDLTGSYRMSFTVSALAIAGAAIAAWIAAPRKASAPRAATPP